LDRDVVLILEPPEQTGAPFRLSARFYDTRDRLALMIWRNEWQVGVGNYDVKVVGQTIRVYEAADQVALGLAVHPPHNVIIESLRMLHRGYRIGISPQQVSMRTPSGKEVFTGFAGEIAGVPMILGKDNLSIGGNGIAVNNWVLTRRPE